MSIGALGPPLQAGADRLFELHSDLPGLDYVNVSGDDQQIPILEQNGQGVALLDFDGDGWLDLFVTNGGTLDGWRRGVLPGSSLFRNLGSWQFQNVTESARLPGGIWGTGAAAADYDEDGDFDLYVAAWGPNRLYRNNGDGSFADVTEVARVGDSRWSSSAVFADFDGDGLLDLYVSNYVEFDPQRVPLAEEDGSRCLYRGVESGCGPWRYPGVRDSLYLQAADHRFEDVSETWGLAATDGYRGMGVAPGDFDSDGDVDVYVACDVMPNLYLTNEAGRGFRSVGELWGGARNASGQHQSGMGVAAADLFAHGSPDLLTTNFAGETNTYYRNEQGQLIDRSRQVGFDLHRQELGWGVVVADFDLDGWQDVFVANGHIYPQVSRLDDPADTYEQAQRIFLNTGRSLEELAESSAFGEPEPVRLSLRAVVGGDLDNDGDVDLIAVQHRGPLLALENLSVRRGVTIQLEARNGGLSPHGTRLSVGRQQRFHWPNQGYQSSHDPRIAVAFDRSARVLVRWPDGARQDLPLPRAGTVLSVRASPTFDRNAEREQSGSEGYGWLRPKSPTAPDLQFTNASVYCAWPLLLTEASVP